MWLRDWGKNRIFYQLTPDFDGFWFFVAYWVHFGSFLKSPTQMGSLSINNSVTNISRLNGHLQGQGCWAGPLKFCRSFGDMKKKRQRKDYGTNSHLHTSVLSIKLILSCRVSYFRENNYFSVPQFPTHFWHVTWRRVQSTETEKSLILFAHFGFV
jgi:hypothetical protein